MTSTSSGGTCSSFHHDRVDFRAVMRVSDTSDVLVGNTLIVTKLEHNVRLRYRP